MGKDKKREILKKHVIYTKSTNLWSPGRILTAIYQACFFLKTVDNLFNIYFKIVLDGLDL